MCAICFFRSMENKHGIDRVKDCVKKFYEFLREHATKIVNFKKNRNEIINNRTAGIL